MLHYMRLAFERLITADSLTKLYHDTVTLAVAFLHDLLFATAFVITVYVFRKPLSELLSRVTKHKNSILGETEFGSSPPIPSKFGEIPHDSSSTSNTTDQREPTVQEPIEYYKSAHFFWLGSDLMESINSVAVTANRELTIQALNQVLRHFRKSGLRENSIEERAKWLIDINTKKLPSEWNTESFRRDVLNEIIVLKSKISALVDYKAGNQFKPWED